MPDTLLVWVDIETSGLDHESDHMLELASVVTDRAGVELGRFEEVVNVGAPVSELCMGEAVEAMHKANGLLDRVAAAGEGRNEDAVIDAWLEWAAGWMIGTGARLVLAGSGIARFDVPWLQARAGIRRAVAVLSVRVRRVGAGVGVPLVGVAVGICRAATYCRRRSGRDHWAMA